MRQDIVLLKDEIAKDLNMYDAQLAAVGQLLLRWLLTPTVVAERGFFFSVCLSVCLCLSARYLKNRYSLLAIENFLPKALETYLFWV